MELFYLSAHEAARLLQNKEISAVELTREILKRIEQVEDKVKAFVTLTPEKALEQAKAVDEARARGENLGPLAGVPMALKDNLCTEGIRTTCSSKMLENWIPPYDAFVVRKLREAGAILVGKCNMDEFAMGSSTENSRFFPTRNPWDLDRVPGGSSGGSAAAVAAGEAFFALGSDTGGSIRQPASFCGVVGLKPTYGRVSRYGLVAFASSLDQIGPLTRDVTDCALVLQAIAGHDPLDSTSADLPVPDYLAALRQDIKGLKIGVPKEYFGPGMDREVVSVVRQAIDRLSDLGAFCEETSLPHTEYALPAYYLVAPAEASSNLARYDGVAYGFRLPGKDVVDMYMKTRREGFGAEVKRRIMLGTYALSAGYYDAYYLKALKVRTLIRRDFDQAFEKYDVLVTPTSPTVAFRLGERVGDPLAMYMSDLCTIPVNMAGLPAISIPCGFAQGLPVGLQIIAKPFAEEILFRVAYTFEQATGNFRRWPEI
ncbi:MAG: Asp-tRNA(Asn)/Glu-tRNA(Gln) amidotransferase subunit GatA [Thermanaeromonas sp.]|uniref:Asp-tRNA(Asn)/Glu-tRNA(Gln) amidotransferase subunit GatA n=1 Tax=Thermanaeromonas sp. TaxID=2003697 RepID=UPI00243D605E|nr:Asp-tRNA(Asn)/Glu-tRNA(Gln) amidotransferase subunit GatA [Thermanaeromonas sp.]MCG0278031.1 Asp-tRNA(Asn)/Glu-tRNA(Gln) amidotransferase subunit GatA [Thermanaeromonas sp.]